MQLIRTQYVIEEGIGILILNRPDKHNALDMPLIAELTQLLTTAEQNAEIRVIVMKATGPNFCAGADLHWMQGTSESESIIDPDVRQLAQLLKTMDGVSKPIIGLVQGAVLGGGIGLLSCCDFVVATPRTRFCFPEVKLGLIPAVIAPYVLRRIGYNATRRYFITAELFSAVEAQTISLIHQIVEEAQLESTGYTLAQSLMKNGPQALSQVKQLLNKLYPIHADTLEHMSRLLTQLRFSEEAQEGIEAFLNKRLPSWA